MPYDHIYNVNGEYSVLAFLLWVVILIDLILLGIWLWQQIDKK